MIHLKEADVLKAILGYLRGRGIVHWRINTGAAKYRTPSGADRFVRYGHPGMSDIMGILPTGRFLAIEVKAPKGTPTELQLEYLELVRRNGGVAFIARSVEDVEKELNALPW